MTIRLATDADMVEIKRWLEAEDQELDHSFICNWNVIENVHARGQAYALVGDTTDLPVAFLCVSDYQPEILSVKVSERKKGLGREMAEFMIDLWRKKGDAVIEIQCVNFSEPFWEKMGFTVYSAHHAYLELPKALPLPPGDKVSLTLSFYEESGAAYDGTAAPLMVAQPEAIRTSDGAIMFGERVFYFTGQNRIDEIVVAITVDGIEIHRDRVKYLKTVDKQAFGYALEQLDPTDFKVRKIVRS